MGKKTASAKQRKKIYQKEFNMALKAMTKKTNKRKERSPEHDAFAALDQFEGVLYESY